MKIAVLGASGFIGRNFIQLLPRHHIIPKVVVRDNKTQFAECEMILVKSFSVTRLKEALRGVDVVVNFIGRFPQPFTAQLATNVDTLANICEAVDYEHIKQFIHFSAAAAYGARHIPPKESDALSPDTTYGLSKQLGEEVILHFHKTHNLPYVLFRPTNVYGKTAKQGVIYSMVSSAKNERVIRVTGDGQQLRDFIHIDDVTSAIMEVIRQQKINTIYNLSSQEVVSVRALAQQVVKQVNANAHVEYVAENTTSIKILTANNSKLRYETGWMPLWNLYKGIDQVAQSV